LLLSCYTDVVTTEKSRASRASADNPGNVASHQPLGAKTRSSHDRGQSFAVSCAHVASLSAAVLVDVALLSFSELQ
jgi:hypothetical protein